MKTRKLFTGEGSFIVAGLLCLALGAPAAAQTAQPTLKENMEAAKKQYVVPGRQLHVTDMKNSYRFCEIGLVTGTTKENMVLNVWNTTGVSDCPQDKFAAMAADKGDKLKQETGAQAIWLNPPRHWTFNEFWVYEVGADRELQGVDAVWMGVVGMEEVKKSTGEGHYNPGKIYRNNTFKFDKGSTVICSTCPTARCWSCSRGPTMSTRAKRRTTSGPREPVQDASGGLEVPRESARQGPDDPRPAAAAPGVGDAGRVPEHLSGVALRRCLQLRSVGERGVSTEPNAGPQKSAGSQSRGDSASRFSEEVSSSARPITPNGS
jgi:hypothetical protein